MIVYSLPSSILLETLDGVCMRTTLCKAGIEQRFSAFFKKLFFKQRN